jgi:hypothetical protein
MKLIGLIAEQSCWSTVTQSGRSAINNYLFSYWLKLQVNWGLSSPTFVHLTGPVVLVSVYPGFYKNIYSVKPADGVVIQNTNRYCLNDIRSLLEDEFEIVDGHLTIKPKTLSPQF